MRLRRPTRAASAYLTDFHPKNDECGAPLRRQQSKYRSLYRETMAPRPSSSSAAASTKKNGGMKQGSLFSFFSKKSQAAAPKPVSSNTPSPLVASPNDSPPPAKTLPPSSAGGASAPLGQAKNSASNPELLSQVRIGVSIEVYWVDDDTWYGAKVAKQRGHSYYLEYDDGQCEWIDLSTEPFRLVNNKKKKRCIREDDGNDEEEVEFEMPDDSDDEESTFKDDTNDNDNADEEDDDQWMVTDDEDDQDIIDAKKSKKSSKKQKTSNERVGTAKNTTSRSSTSASLSSSLLGKFAAGKVTVTEHGKTPSSDSTVRSTPKQITPGTQWTPTFSQPSPLAGITTASTKTTTTTTTTTVQQSKQAPPPAFDVGALNPAGSHVHNHLNFLNNPVDLQGQSPDYPDYDPRTLKVVERDWIKITDKKMTDAVKQWWDLKSQYFDTVLLFKLGTYGEQSVGLARLVVLYVTCRPW